MIIGNFQFAVFNSCVRLTHSHTSLLSGRMYPDRRDFLLPHFIRLKEKTLYKAKEQTCFGLLLNHVK